MALAPFPVTAELTAIAIAYRNRALIADRVLPRVPVSLQAFKYSKWPKGTFFTVPETTVGRKGSPNRVEFEGTETESATVDHALDDAVPNSDLENARAQKGMPDPLGRAVEGVTDLLELAREKRTADLVFDTTQYAAAHKTVLAGVTQWSNAASDPIGAITDAMEAAVMPYNVLLLGSEVSLKLRRHPKIVKAHHGSEGGDGLVPLAFIKELFEVEEVLVGSARINTAKKGQAAVLSRCWGKHAALLHRNPLADTQRGTTFGFTAQWGGRIAGSEYDRNVGMRGGQIVRAGESVKELITANDLAHLFQDAIA